MKKKHIIKLISILLAVIFAVGIFTGCEDAEDTPVNDVPQDDTSADNADVNAGTTAQDDGKFTLRYNDAETLNPITCENVYNDAVVSLIYEGLFRLDEAFCPVPVLCSDYTTEDGKVYILNIIDAPMHDGSTLTVEDVVYSINKGRLSSKYGTRLSNIGYCGVQDGSIRIDLNKADYGLPALLDIPIIKDGSADSPTPPGTGPYYFESSGGKAGLTAFEDYRAAQNITVTRIYLEEFADAAVEENFANYTLDAVWEDTAGDSGVNLYSDHEARYYDTSILQYIGFNSKTPVLNDPNIRLAVSYAVNREMILNDIYGGHGQAATLIFNPEHHLYSEDWEEGYGYSTTMISASLAASGLDDRNSDGYLEYPVNGEYQPFELKLIVNSGNAKKIKAAESVVENLRNVGLNVTLVTLSWEEYRAALINGEYDLYYAEVSLTRNFDFSGILKTSGTLNFGKIGDEQCDVLCDGFLSAATEEERAAAAESLCIYVADNGIIAPVMYRQYVVYTHRGVISDFSPTVSGVFSDAAGWTVKTEDK